MKKYRGILRASELLIKKYNSSISEKEHKELSKIIDTYNLKEEDLEAFSDTGEMYNKRKNYKSTYDAERNWDKLQEKLVDSPKTVILRQIYRYTAAAAIFIAVYFSFTIIKNRKPETSSEQTTLINTGAGKAVLETSSGGKYLLEGTKSMEKEIIQGVKMCDCKLVYQDTTRNEKIEYHTIKVPTGGEYTLQLSDGTSVWLFSESKLRYPSVFRGKRREVYLSGEAYFDVSKDKSKPFKVKTSSVDINVLGTSFNVMAYEDSKVVETSLTEGKVSVKDYVLSPEHQLIYNKCTGETSVKEINSQLYKDRRNGIFVFENETLDYILKELSRWYDFEYFYQNPAVKDRLFGFRLRKYENISSILKLLEETKEVKFRIKGKTIIVSDI